MPIEDKYRRLAARNKGTRGTKIFLYRDKIAVGVLVPSLAFGYLVYLYMKKSERGKSQPEWFNTILPNLFHKVNSQEACSTVAPKVALINTNEVKEKPYWTRRTPFLYGFDIDEMEYPEYVDGKVVLPKKTMDKIRATRVD